MTESSDEIKIPPFPPPPVGPRTSAHMSEKPFRVDASGASGNWKVIGGILAFFIASGTLWTALGLAKTSDVHVVLEDKGEAIPVTTVVKKQYAIQKDNDKVHEDLKKGMRIVATVKLDLDTDRAERLADRAADRVEDPRQSREVWKTVRDAALQNLRAEPPRPIRASLERYLD